ncbi:hypothetical protein AURDEDRAFT_131754 [Auricularia subglabra TFB-10046 SS5]|uniref:Uncharacterized protein n=1 Tax=Auricularia subglabra (strain TFB-10046 / SS5) TaxID=717982 RepID=J0D3Q2_AURST|nr:hypothetical protein AURDEDRAFT_131754 [Auricularia subglabra TFB-10046 SS5]
MVKSPPSDKQTRRATQDFIRAIKTATSMAKHNPGVLDAVPWPSLERESAAPDTQTVSQPATEGISGGDVDFAGQDFAVARQTTAPTEFADVLQASVPAATDELLLLRLVAVLRLECAGVTIHPDWDACAVVADIVDNLALYSVNGWEVNGITITTPNLPHIDVVDDFLVLRIVGPIFIHVDLASGARPTCLLRLSM